jgi:hypothetical protein
MHMGPKGSRSEIKEALPKTAKEVKDRLLGFFPLAWKVRWKGFSSLLRIGLEKEIVYNPKR